jgi:hypothetical protein
MFHAGLDIMQRYLMMAKMPKSETSKMLALLLCYRGAFLVPAELLRLGENPESMAKQEALSH